MAPQGQAVRFRDCTCPDTPHSGRDGADDGDIVIMRDHLDFVAGMEVARLMVEATRSMDLSGIVPGEDLTEQIKTLLQQKTFEYLAPVYLREGPISWNVLDEQGPIPLTKDALADIPYSQGLPIVQAADNLYSDEVASPLVARTNGRSPGTSTGRKTSRKTRSSSPRRSPSSSSLRNGSAGRPSPVNP